MGGGALCWTLQSLQESSREKSLRPGELRDAFHTSPLNPLRLTSWNPSGPHSTQSLWSFGALGGVLKMVHWCGTWQGTWVIPGRDPLHSDVPLVTWGFWTGLSLPSFPGAPSLEEQPPVVVSFGSMKWWGAGAGREDTVCKGRGSGSEYPVWGIFNVHFLEAAG